MSDGKHRVLVVGSRAVDSPELIAALGAAARWSRRG